ncbi:hypothetical protein BC828DRAFT_390505 [Blastocladiella britannica]|nr:hypothetical protein BC828DRAFT_390505 [Blastocladiella britannica]
MSAATPSHSPTTIRQRATPSTLQRILPPRPAFNSRTRPSSVVANSTPRAAALTPLSAKSTLSPLSSPRSRDRPALRNPLSDVLPDLALGHEPAPSPSMRSPLVTTTTPNQEWSDSDEDGHAEVPVASEGIQGAPSWMHMLSTYGSSNISRRSRTVTAAAPYYGLFALPSTEAAPVAAAAQNPIDAGTIARLQPFVAATPPAVTLAISRAAEVKVDRVLFADKCTMYLSQAGLYVQATPLGRPETTPPTIWYFPLAQVELLESPDSLHLTIDADLELGIAPRNEHEDGLRRLRDHLSQLMESPKHIDDDVDAMELAMLREIDAESRRHEQALAAIRERYKSLARPVAESPPPLNGTDTREECGLCFSEPIAVELSPCSHALCARCWSRLESTGKCPWDRQTVTGSPLI